jgi:hypothetical protein
MASHTMAWLGNVFFLVHTILVSHQNFSTFFFPSYFVAQEANVAPRVSTTREVIETNRLTSSLGPITRAKGVRVVMPQYFRPLNTKEERTLLTRGEETTTPQVARASNFRVP